MAEIKNATPGFDTEIEAKEDSTAAIDYFADALCSSEIRLEQNFAPIGDEERNFAEASKYEILGLRQEMNQYMHHQFLVENFSLTAAAVAFSYLLTIVPDWESIQSQIPGDGEVQIEVNLGNYSLNDFIKTSFLSTMIMVILWFGYERLKLLRYRISRLGLYVFFREKMYPNRLGWEHFVYQFRMLDLNDKQTDIVKQFSVEKWEDRSKKLNALVKEIDGKPGKFTFNLYWRWRVILFISFISCVAQTSYVGYRVPEVSPSLCKIYSFDSLCSISRQDTARATERI